MTQPPPDHPQVPPPLDPDLRAALLADLRAIDDGTSPERSAGSIARAHDVARTTVTRLAAAEGLAHLWQRDQTKRAAEAAQVDNRARRATLASALLDDIERLRERFFTTYTFVGSTKDGIDTLELAEPPADAVRNYVTAAAVLIDKHVALEKVDSDEGTGEGRSAVAAFMAAVRASGPVPDNDDEDLDGELDPEVDVIPPDDEPYE